MAQQLRLRLRRPASYSRDEFVQGPSNAQATAAVDAWPSWHAGCLVLVGGEGVGKTHLAQAWAVNAKAVVLGREAPDVAAAAGRPVLLEDVDQGVPDEALFHLINLAGHKGGGLLLTARTAPARWPATLPDLRSRLNALPVAEVEEPDDVVLEGVLRKFFRERSIRPPKEVYAYLLRRMERSIPGAREIVRRLDEAADGPISRVLAREVLEGDNQNLDLFE
ncbi:chromosomal replication initiator DnaA [Phenylobacterium hankyongense]|uniref:Chromosomal replication initiator DnaA n=1 Tax=Phenylobacterium hankyongense TaxID=1813876 RepID=A0A328B8E9_9CAUL|nr:DnaA/Hda family protein [Phenylobacterium hankyongense]RAK61258.1 chromosomal replication initiator DnaA [Phenylobacterium hankyongense]